MANLTDEQKKAFQELQKQSREATKKVTEELKNTAKNEGVGAMIFKIVIGAAFLLFGGKK